MKITVAVLLLVAISYAAGAESKEKTTTSKTDKRDLPEGNYGDRTHIKNVLRSVQVIDSSNAENEAGRSSQAYSPSSPRIAKISDVLSSEGPHYSTISDHLSSPVSAYQSRLASPTLDQNTGQAVAEPEYKPKPSIKQKKTTIPLKRPYPTYQPNPFKFDPLSNFANYDFSQFRNVYQQPRAFGRGLTSPRIFSDQFHVRPAPQPVIAQQYYPQIYQQPQVYQQRILQSQRSYIQPVQQPVQVPTVAYPQVGQQIIPNQAYTQGAQQIIANQAYTQGAQQIIPNQAYTQGAQQIIPNQAYTQGAQQIIPNQAYTQGALQIIPNQAYTQGAQQILPNQAYTQGAQQIIANQAYTQGAQQIIPNQAYTQGAEQIIPNQAYTQGAQQIIPNQAYTQGAEQIIPNQVYTQGAQQAIPEVAYFHGAQQVIPSVPYAQNSNQVVPGVVYAQNNQQAISGLTYAQDGQRILPNTAYAQGPQQAGVTYTHHQNQQLQENIQPQLIRVTPQQPASQQHINVKPQQTQGAVSYASFSQSLPPYSHPQSYPNPQEQQTPSTQHALGQALGQPTRPDVTGHQPLQPVPDSQPQAQQISDSHSQPTLQPNQEQTFVTPVPDKEDQISTQNLPSEPSNPEPTTQRAPQDGDHSQSTQVPLIISTQPNLVQSRRQVLQQAIEKGLTYIQQVPQAYPQGLVFQQPGLVNGGVAPTIPSIQYFGNYADSLYRNYH